VELRFVVELVSEWVSRLLNRFPHGHRSMRTLGSPYPFCFGRLLRLVVASVLRSLLKCSSVAIEVLLGRKYYFFVLCTPLVAVAI